MTALEPEQDLQQDRDVVELRLPADAAYLSVLRTATAGLAARLDFTLDEIEDLRIAVDEACALLLQDATPSGQIVCSFWLSETAMEISVTASSTTGHLPGRDSFSWTVLTALAGEVESTSLDGLVTIVLRKRRGGHGPR